MMALTLMFNNGRQMSGLLWTWRPEEGWLEALNEKTGQIKRYKLKDIKGGTLWQTRDRRSNSGENILEKAIAEGFEN